MLNIEASYRAVTCLMYAIVCRSHGSGIQHTVGTTIRYRFPSFISVSQHCVNIFSMCR